MQNERASCRRPELSLSTIRVLGIALSASLKSDEGSRCLFRPPADKKETCRCGQCTPNGAGLTLASAMTTGTRVLTGITHYPCPVGVF